MREEDQRDNEFYEILYNATSYAETIIRLDAHFKKWHYTEIDMSAMRDAIVAEVIRRKYGIQNDHYSMWAMRN